MQIKRFSVSDYKELTRLRLRVKLPFKPKGRGSKKAIEKQIHANPEFLCLNRGRQHVIQRLFQKCDYVEHRGVSYFNERGSNEV